MQRFAALVLFTCFGLGVQPTSLEAESPAEREARTIINLLNEPIETKDFTTPMTFKDMAGLIYEKFAAKGLELPIDVNRALFRDADAKNAFDPWEASVSLPPVPRQLTVGTALRTVLAQFPVETTFLIRNAHVEIVPDKLARSEHLLKLKVAATFDNAALVEAVQELSGQTGLSIVIDIRLAEVAKRRVTATFRNDVTLRDALLMLAEMADLRIDFRDSGAFVTAAVKAAR